MSKVICFRLDESNPREAHALAILKNRYEQGHRLRDTIVEALVRSGDGDDKHATTQYDDVRYMLDELQTLIRQIQNGQIVHQENKPLETSQLELTEGFLDAVRKAAKPGLRTGS